MKHLTLSNGVEIPILGYGTYGLTGEEGYNCIKEALQLGYRMVDTAHMYGNEKEVGRAIIDSGIPREEIFVVSKLDSRSNSYEKAKKQIDKSLSDMKLSYIDLYLIHEPYKESVEMWKAFEEAYEQGKLRSIGISNFFGKRFDNFIEKVKIMPMVNQIESHVYFQRLNEQMKFKEKGIVMMSFSPLIQCKVNFFNEPVLVELSKKYNKTVPQIVLNYLASNDIVVIPKTSKKSRMIENMNIFDFALTSEEMNKIKNLDRNQTMFSWTKAFES